jgi:hypothetical protein
MWKTLMPTTTGSPANHSQERLETLGYAWEDGRR